MNNSDDGHAGRRYGTEAEVQWKYMHDLALAKITNWGSKAASLGSEAAVRWEYTHDLAFAKIMTRRWVNYSLGTSPC